LVSKYLEKGSWIVITSSLQWFEMSDNVGIGHATSKTENYMDSPFWDWLQVLSLWAVNEVMPGRRSVFENWADYCSVEMEKLFVWNSRSIKLLQPIEPFASFWGDTVNVCGPGEVCVKKVDKLTVLYKTSTAESPDRSILLMDLLKATKLLKSVTCFGNLFHKLIILTAKKDLTDKLLNFV